MDETEDAILDRPDITGPLPRYRLRRQLSQTRMSDVFDADDLEYGRVALKVISPELMRQPGFAARFDRESHIAITLKHPNIVDVYAAGKSDDGRLGYLAMRFIDGANLREVLDDRGRRGLDETVTIARQVAAALDAAHDQGLIHRDVKPANILLESTTNQVYLCDFGIAKNTALTSVTATDAAIGTEHYLSPEQRANGRDVDHRTDVYSLGCVLYDCLAGQAWGAARDRRVCPVPFLGSPVDRVLRKALSDDPARRHATCGELADELAVAARKTPQLRRLSIVLASAVLTLLAVLVGAVAVVLSGPDPDRMALDRIPAALRNDCSVVAAAMVGASAALSCRDAAGRTAVTALFADSPAASAAYTRAISESGVSRGQGDCAKASGAEHRYPTTGPARGRILCYERDGKVLLVWTDDEARTVSRVDAPIADTAPLRQSWSGWIGAETAYPTADERTLQEVAAGTDCVRASVIDLDAFTGAVAAVTCVPRGSGARAVSYYRFGSLAELRAAFTGRVNSAKAPNGVACATGAARNFLGTQRHDWLGVDLGQVLCQPGPDGTLAMDWSTEPLLIGGRVLGTQSAALAGWWSQWHLAPLGRIVAAANAQAAPPFPTEPERALLGHIPPISRSNCVRPSPEQVWRDVGATPVVGVLCGPTSGAAMVAYYQFRDVAAMRSVYGPFFDSEKPCTSLPDDFSGDRAYSREGGGKGRLRCGVDEGTKERFLEWTDERLNIGVFTHQGTEPFAMIDWWAHDAGPI